MIQINLKRIFICLLGLFGGILLCEAQIIPKPEKIIEYPGSMQIDSKLKATGFLSDLPEIQSCVGSISQIMSNEPMRGTIPVQIKEDPQLVNEAYKLKIDKEGIRISSGTANGVFYALQSLKQLILFSCDGSLPYIEIMDAPRFEWRGLMLDESRHFFGMEKVKKLLDQMAIYKLNRFHWHLTDNNGWRIEIMQYPKLSTVGGVGNLTDSTADARFYTQKEIREIVEYASQRFIEIIPEIDMPGHARAAAISYPAVAGGGTRKHPNFTFNPGAEVTYEFLSNILTEVSELFPSQWIHYGGDEVHFANKQWLKIPGVQRLMAEENLNDLKDVEKYFNRRMAGVISDLDRKTVAWDEVVYSGLDKEESLLMWWRHDKLDVLEDIFAQNYQVVLCPRVPLYFDFVQDEAHQVGRRWDSNFGSLDKVYAFPEGLNIVESQVKGIQGNIWSERISSEKRLDFMTYLRLQGLSEASWTGEKNKDYKEFLLRLENYHLPYLSESNIYYFNPFNKEEHPEPLK